MKIKAPVFMLSLMFQAEQNLIDVYREFRDEMNEKERDQLVNAIDATRAFLEEIMPRLVEEEGLY